MSRDVAPMPVSQTLREAAKRSREIALHLDRAADDIAHDLTPDALDRIEQHLCHAHTKTSRVKAAATRGLKVVESLREGLAA